MMRLETATRRPGLAMRGGIGGPPSSRALADLDGKQSALLASFKGADGEHSELLTSLMVSNTLLELSKLMTSRLGVGEFASATLNTLSQCAPVEGCAMVMSSLGIPPIYCTLGDWPTEENQEKDQRERQGTPRELHAAPLYGKGDEPIGYLGLTGVPKSLISAGLLERTADYLTSILSLLIEAEYLRRAAAAAKVLELVGSLNDEYDEADLYEIVSTIQSLPGAIGASMLLEVPRFAGPLLSEAGLFPSAVSPAVREEPIETNGTVTLKVWWGQNGTPPEDSRLDEIVDRLVSFLQRAEQTARLRSEVETDELTGIGNRRRASKALAQASARSRRTGEEYSILLMDLDKFKNVNDTLGHEIGDEVLRSFSRAIEQVIRGYDVTARWGGEEFLIVCPGTSQPGAEALARRLLRDTPILCGRVLPEEWVQTVSIGIAVCQNSAADPVELVRVADAAMYEAKTSGRNRYVVGSPKARDAKP
jgi:diguanylate cyclase (GGDEF)-like protein